MSLFTDLKNNLYKDCNKFVTICAKVILFSLVSLAAFLPIRTGDMLHHANKFIITYFGGWYIYVMAFYLLVCFVLLFLPATTSTKLGKINDKPEFSRFSWFSMMFSAGIGIGMLTYATAEPIYHFANNPDVIKGLVDGSSVDSVRSAYKWSFFHWGLSAWACYALVGLALAFFSYNKGMPLTIRSSLSPLLGDSKWVGNVVDIMSIIATILGVSVTLGYGISQFTSGIFNISNASWLMNDDGSPAILAMIIALIIIASLSIFSALSGVSKGIKWLSNINIGLSIFLLLFFLIFGSTLFSLKSLFVGIFDYLTSLPSMAITSWVQNGSEVGDKLASWQKDWTILYFAWWIAFAPFVGLFLARISKGRSLGEYIIGAVCVPSLMCFIWFSIVGGTAIDLELSGIAKGEIINADISAQLFAMINIMLTPFLAKIMSIIIVILLLTYLVTSADSAILVINTITSTNQKDKKSSHHIVIWGVVLILLIATLLVAGGMVAIQSAMIVGTLPFSIILALMGLSLIKSLILDRKK